MPITVKLALEGSKLLKVTSKSNITDRNENDTYNNATKHISDLFTPKQYSDGGTFTPKVILIEGAPGMGKSFLSKEIAYQWANNTLLTSKQLLFLILLRNFDSTIKSVEDFVYNVFKSKSIAESAVKHILENNGEHLAIVLDGYDELSEKDRRCSFIADVVSRRVLSKSLLVITSRPTASLHLRDYVNCRIEVVGFSEADRLDYIKSELPDSCESITNYLKSNPMINALCYIPLNMTILLSLIKKDISNLPETQTELYESFIKETIARHLKRVSDVASSIIVSELPPPQSKELFNELAHFAFNALGHDRLVFTFDELKISCPKLTMTPGNWNGLGLIHSVKRFDDQETVTYHFFHFAIQEYMAAHYITLLEDKEQIKLLQDTFWTIRYYNTWIMYAGITGGKSFALMHFLSKNLFKVSTAKLLKSPTHPKHLNKYLGDKIKSLHVFQCLAETKNESMIALVGGLFKDQAIDLSNQTLLPRDLNTLVFFLLRSHHKVWKMLNLSKCSMGINGCKVLLEGLFKHGTQANIRIDKVNLSHNQLTLLSLVSLFELIKSWNTSEIIITDTDILHNTTGSTLFAKIENTFILSNNSISLQRLSVGSFLFSYKPNLTIISDNLHIKSLYLLGCEITKDIHSICDQLVDIHFLDSHVSEDFVLSHILSNSHKIGSVFLYDSNLSDKLADEIGKSIITHFSSGVKLLISKTKVHGILNTTSLSDDLSNLEILNLIAKLNRLQFSNDVQSVARSLFLTDSKSIAVWRNDLQFWGNKSEAISQNFVYLLLNFKIYFQLKLAEQNTLIAHKIKFKDIEVDINNSLTAVYLSDCELSDMEYESIIENGEGTPLLIIYILHSSLKLEVLYTSLSKYIFALQEVFLHSTCICGKESLCSLLSAIPIFSAVIVTNDTLVLHNPTNKQLSLALQLEPSVTVCVLVNCKLKMDTFNMILWMLMACNTNWVEVDLKCCHIRNVDCEVTNEYLNMIKSMSSIRTLNLSAMNLTSSITSTISNIAFKWNIEEIIIYNCNKFLHCLIEKLKKALFKSTSKVCLSVSCGNIKVCYFNNVKWEKIVKTATNKTNRLFMVNCQLFEIFDHELIAGVMSKLLHLSQICFINCAMQESMLCKIFSTFVEKDIEISMFNTTPINGMALYNLVGNEKFFSNSRLHFLVVMDNFLCCYNVTVHQLDLLKLVDHSFSAIEHNVNITKLKSIFVVQDLQFKLSYFIAQSDKLGGAAPICLKANISFFKSNDIIKTGLCLWDISCVRQAFTIASKAWKNGGNRISSKVLASSSSTTQDNFSSIYSDRQATKLAKLLLESSNMQHLTFHCGKIAEEIGSGIAAVLSGNKKLQVINLSGSNLQTSSVSQITRALRSCNSLQQFDFGGNKATEIAADDIAAVLSLNTNLKVLNLEGNNLLTIGVKRIADSLKHTYTLVELMLGNNDATREAAGDIASVLSHNTHLQIIDLGGNILQSAGIKRIANSLQNTFNLQKLSLDSNYIKGTAADSIAKALLHKVNLQAFTINGNNLQATGVSKVVNALKQACNLQELGLCNNRATEKASKDIAAALSNKNKLQVLNLNGNYLQTSGVITIAKSMQSISTLRELHLSGNNISEEAADDVATVLLCNTKLQVLNLNENNLCSSGISVVVKGLRNTTTLKELHISNNNATEEAAKDLAAVVLHNTQLEVLNFNGNSLKAVGIIEIAKQMATSSLTELYISDNYITEEAANDLSTIIFNNRSLRILNLNRNSLQHRGICKIAKALQCTNTLQQLELCDNMASGAADEIAAVLAHNNKLEKLNLGGNNLQTSGVILIVKQLQNVSTLTELYINDNDITEDAAEDIAVALSSNTNMQVLNLDRNHLQSVGIKKLIKGLKNVITLSKLHIGSNNITKEAANDLATVLSQNTNLQVLNLDGNNLQAEGVRIIAKALPLTLNELYISNNNATKEAADDIAAALTGNIKLHILKLNGNDLHSTGITKIARVLQNKNTLTQLQLRKNSISEEAAGDISAVLSNNTKLQVLNLSDNYLCAKGIAKIFEGLSFTKSLKHLGLNNNKATKVAADDIASVLFRNTNLQVLNLNTNDLQTAGLTKILRALHQTSTLKELDISNNNATKEVADDIASLLSHNTKLQALNLDNNILESEGFTKIAKSLCKFSSAFIKLYIGNNNITDTAANDVAAVLSHNRNLHVLNLSGNIFKARGIRVVTKAMEKISMLQELHMNESNITEEVVNNIATVVSQNNKLRVLCLNGNSLYSRGAINIAKGLLNINTLQNLEIGNNNITKEAADNLAAILSHNPSLEVLNLNENNLQAEGVIRICKALQNICTLRRLGLSNNSATREAANDIAQVILHNVKLQVLNLNGNLLHTSGVIIVAEALKKVSDIEMLYIADNDITEKGADDLAAVLSHNINIQVLNLNGNDLQADGIIKICNALQNNRSLLSLGLSNNNCAEQAIDYIVAVLSCSTNLQKLDLDGNNLQMKGATKVANALQFISSLTELNISNNSITQEVASDLGALLFCNTDLQVLNLNGNYLQAAGIIGITNGLLNTNTLQQLWLDYNNATIEAAPHIAAVLSHSTNLQVLSLEGNNLQADGIRMVARALQSTKLSTLRRLYIGNNNITKEAADDIKAVLSHNINLQLLNLNENHLQALGITKICKGLQNTHTLLQLGLRCNNATITASHHIATVLSCNSNLQVLNLDGNDLQAIGTKRIMNALNDSSRLIELYMGDNNATEEAADDIAAALSHNTNLQVLNLSGNNLQILGVIKVVRSLKSLYSLRQLDLCNNNCTSEAANDIAAILSQNINLHALNLIGNAIQSSGIIKIAKSLQQVSHLTEMYINDNNICEKAADDIAACILHTSVLKCFAIGDNNLQTVGIIKIAEALQNLTTLTELHLNNSNITSEAADNLAVVLLHNIKLKVLNLNGNSLQAIGVIKVAKALQNTTTLQLLGLQDNNATAKAADDIAAVLSHNHNLQVLNLNGNNLQEAGVIKVVSSLKNASVLYHFCIIDNCINEDTLLKYIAMDHYVNIS